MGDDSDVEQQRRGQHEDEGRANAEHDMASSFQGIGTAMIAFRQRDWNHRNVEISIRRWGHGRETAGQTVAPLPGVAGTKPLSTDVEPRGTTLGAHRDHGSVGRRIDGEIPFIPTEGGPCPPSVPGDIGAGAADGDESGSRSG